MTDAPWGRMIGDLGDDLELWVCTIAALKEQDVNAQIMTPAQFDRLTENIRTRGQVESLPYCYLARNNPGPAEIVSGHHRVRASRAAGLTEIPVILDRREMTRSQIVSKQLSHNALTGTSDADMLKELLKQVTTVDDLLATGLPENLLPTVDPNPTPITQPRADFDWRTVTFTFLPHQLDNFKTLIEHLNGAQDLVGVAPLDGFDTFAKALGGYSRIRDVRSIGMVIDLLTTVALAETARIEGEATE